MPIFEYRCAQCDTEFEALVRNHESVSCERCGGSDVEKLFSAAAGHVQGSSLSLPMMSACPPPSAGPCGPGCCRLPMG